MGGDHHGIHHEIAQDDTGVDFIWINVDNLTKSAHFLPIVESMSTEKLADIY